MSTQESSLPETPVTNPQESLNEVRRYAKARFGSMDALRAKALRLDGPACEALALYERAMEAKRAMDDDDDGSVTYGDRHLENLLKEVN
jgi:hypothetical protein